MNKVEAQQRILRNLAIICHQVEAQNAHGQNISAYCETAICDAMNAVTSMGWLNINAFSNNFPAIDLITKDGTRGIQATLKTTKVKFDKTVCALAKQLVQKGNRLDGIQEVEVVGLTCVRNEGVTSWRTVTAGKSSVKVRGISLIKLLDLQNQDSVRLSDLDEALQGLTMITPFHLRSDEEELMTIVAYLDRPAIRDHRSAEMSWQEMNEAMRSIRRLLGQGADDQGHQITRPYRTFQPQFARLLKGIYTETEAISTLLRDELHSRGSLKGSDGILIDGHRLRIQEDVTALAMATNSQPPIW
ncbi:SMEK domain-containing protein [Kribbella sp. NPDC006257]|uniref:SMEK domain-containing protein n=1 Tax=Kribbella sp. NPDC006257 TaxID=3156738 RepID=UPI0033AE7A53